MLRSKRAERSGMSWNCFRVRTLTNFFARSLVVVDRTGDAEWGLRLAAQPLFRFLGRSRVSRRGRVQVGQPCCSSRGAAPTKGARAAHLHVFFCFCFFVFFVFPVFLFFFCFFFLAAGVAPSAGEQGYTSSADTPHQGNSRTQVGASFAVTSGWSPFSLNALGLGGPCPVTRGDVPAFGHSCFGGRKACAG